MSLMKMKVKNPAGFFLILVLVAFVLSGCALFKRGEMKLNSPEALYEKGVEYYQKEKYKKAIEMFQRVKEEYPLSKYALMAELGIADSYFSDDLFIEAETNYNEFINLHPTNPNLPYVIYQIGMCHYKQMMTIDRDQAETIKAKKEFERLLSQFPSSKFAALSEKNLRECRQRLAEQEFYVAHFYFKMKQYKAALKRLESLAANYPNLGLDYKVGYFIEETKRGIRQQELEKEKEKEKEKLAKEKEQAEKLAKEKTAKKK